MDKNTETGNSKKQSAVVAALVIGLLSGFFIGRSWGSKYEENEAGEKAKIENVADVSVANDSLRVPEDSSKVSATVSSGNATGAVVVAEQNAGMSVIVSKVTLSDAGWVVVRETAGEAMGNILGALWLPAGTASDVSVELLRKTEANKNYFIVLYNDNSDKKFDKTTDAPIEMDGKVVSGVFLAK